MGAKVGILPPVPWFPLLPKFVGVTDTVIIEPVSEKVVLVTADAVRLGVNISVLAIASRGWPVVLAILAMLATLVPSFRIPDASRRIGVPAIVTPGPPAEIVVP